MTHNECSSFQNHIVAMNQNAEHTKTVETSCVDGEDTSKTRLMQRPQQEWELYTIRSITLYTTTGFTRDIYT